MDDFTDPLAPVREQLKKAAARARTAQRSRSANARWCGQDAERVVKRLRKRLSDLRAELDGLERLLATAEDWDKRHVDVVNGAVWEAADGDR